MANYKKQKKIVKVSFTYKGVFYKKDAIFEGKEAQILSLKQFLKQ